MIKKERKEVKQVVEVVLCWERVGLLGPAGEAKGDGSAGDLTRSWQKKRSQTADRVKKSKEERELKEEGQGTASEEHLAWHRPTQAQKRKSLTKSVGLRLPSLLLRLVPSFDETQGTNGSEEKGEEGEKQTERGQKRTEETEGHQQKEFPWPFSADCSSKSNQRKIWSATEKVTPIRIKECQRQRRTSKKQQRPNQKQQQRRRVSPLPPQSADQMPLLHSADHSLTIAPSDFFSALQQFFSSADVPGPSSSCHPPTVAQVTADRMVAEMGKTFAEQAQHLLDGMAELAPNANAEELLNAASLAMAAHFGALMPQSQNPPIDELLGQLLWQNLVQSVATTADGREGDSGIGMEQEETTTTRDTSLNSNTNEFISLPSPFHALLSASSALSFSVPSVNDGVVSDQCSHPSVLNQPELVDCLAKALANGESAGNPLNATALTALWLGMAQQHGDNEPWQGMLRQAVEDAQKQNWDEQMQWRNNRAQTSTPFQSEGQSPLSNDGTKDGIAEPTASPIHNLCNENGTLWPMTKAAEGHSTNEQRRAMEVHEKTDQLSSREKKQSDSKELMQMEAIDQLQLIGIMPFHLSQADIKQWTTDAQQKGEFGDNRRKNPREGRHRAMGGHQRTNAPGDVPVPPLSTVPGTGTLTAKSEKSLGALLRQQPEGAERAEELDELEEFANFFKKQRIKHGFTQGDVGVALGKRYGTDFSQTTISRFEALNLSFKNMCKLRPLLQDWLEETDRLLSAGATVQDVMEGVALQKVASLVAAINMDQQQRQSVPNEPIGVDEDNGPSTAFSKLLPPFKKRRKRTNLDTAQKLSLDAFFRMDARPDNSRMNEIATLLDLDQDVVRVWFCNRRQKLRKL
ncbi:hypothetical protein niasHT_011004 [Heterodera trifolii]|uniref:POU domain protein n=1 Tax=Heterodera trifolii TaxID=157864 RepID=A0ABD2L9Y1_9BILA